VNAISPSRSSAAFALHCNAMSLRSQLVFLSPNYEQSRTPVLTGARSRKPASCRFRSSAPQRYEQVPVLGCLPACGLCRSGEERRSQTSAQCVVSTVRIRRPMRLRLPRRLATNPRRVRHLFSAQCPITGNCYAIHQRHRHSQANQSRLVFQARRV
jgi:hypothetical protein